MKTDDPLKRAPWWFMPWFQTARFAASLGIKQPRWLLNIVSRKLAAHMTKILKP
jgi:hypothetical protein